MQQLGSNLARGPCLQHLKIILSVNCFYRTARVIIIQAVNTRHYDFDVTKYSDKCIETTMIALSECSKCTKARLRDLNVSTLSEWSRAYACPSKYNMPTVFSPQAIWLSSTLEDPVWPQLLKQSLFPTINTILVGRKLVSSWWFN